MIALYYRVAVTATLLIVILLSAVSHAQQPPTKADSIRAQPSATPPPDDVIKINSNLVQVDAVVTDKQGRQVTDLTATDFEIIEDGKARTPEFFSYISVNPPDNEKPASGQPSGRDLRRVFVFVVSNPIINVGFSFPGRNGGPPTTGSFSSQARAQRAADSARSLLTWFVDTQMTDVDLAAIADTDVDLGVLASYTNDRDVLRAAIKEVRENASNGKSPVINVMFASGDIALQPLMKQNVRILETLENVIAQIARLPGRKVVALVARGLLYNPRVPYWQVIEQRVKRLIDMANRAQIAVYSLQLRDLSPSGNNVGDDGLIDLARETGGRAIYNTNDLRVGFADVMEENRGYYLLAYNPGPEAVGRPHRLQVRVKRPGVKVLTRSESFARRAITVGDSNPLDSPLAQKELKITISPTIEQSDRGPRIVTSCKIDLDQAEARLQDDGAQAFSLVLSVRIAGPDGRLLKQVDRDVSFNVKPNELEIARRDGFLSKFEIDAGKPGFYRISVAVRDTQSGLVGSQIRFFQVAKSGIKK